MFRKLRVVLENTLQEVQQSIAADVKSLPPQIQKMLKSIGFNGQRVDIKTAEEVSPFNAGWEGRQALFVIFDLASGKVVTQKIGSFGGANMFNRDNQVDNDRNYYKIPDGAGVFEGYVGATFGSITINPRNMNAGLLPSTAGGEELTREQLVFLHAAGLVSSYKKKQINDQLGNTYMYTIDRNKNKYEITKKGLEVWKSLVDKGLIKSMTQMSRTTDGENLHRQSRDLYSKHKLDYH